METDHDTKGNLIVTLDNPGSHFLNRKPEYYHNAPEIVSWAPNWLLVPLLDYYVTGILKKPQTVAVPYGEDPRIRIPNFYGGTTFDPSRITYPVGMPRWTVVQEEWKKDSTGLYYWTLAKQGFRIFIERHILDILREVHGPKFAGQGSTVPVIPAWKSGKLVSRMVPFAPLEQYVVEPPFPRPEQYIVIKEVEDRTKGELIRSWEPAPGITFEELLSAGHNLEGAESAVVVQKPFSFGVVYKVKHEITTTLTPPSQGIPNKWKRKILNYFDKIEKLGGAGTYYLPLTTFTLIRACAGEYKPPHMYLVPSAWAVVIDFVTNAPVAFLNKLIKDRVLGYKARLKEA